ncbi:hypothetical protein J7337_009775 [Fusarium musae]|uniref:Uncharacterized protein n=1 Tax=Fusarium musae TaxID=1042133 RepID=A0A9P8IMK1_9HYPO|nr:hypothetical protein J7337_009775 [Fusarium musae]KAG9498964.1 hypothetical protein J7337_009775 [Fusarium musae]
MAWFMTPQATSAPSARIGNTNIHAQIIFSDKDKDDPQLRDVLAQRPDGPNRGRRRRGPAA